MRVLIAMFTLLLPIVTAAEDLGPYRITGGDISGAGANLQGNLTGNGFIGTFVGYPEPLYAGALTNFHGGTLDFSMALSPPEGRDFGGYLSISGPRDLAAEGLVPINYSVGTLPYVSESGGISASINVAGAGTITAPFSLSATLPYGAPNATVPEQHVNFVGGGTLIIIVQDFACGVLNCLRIEHTDYSFRPIQGSVSAPELDPSEASAALTLLIGAIAVIRGRRAMRRSPPRS